MKLFKSKQLDELRLENDELKAKFQHMYDKEESAKYLEKVLLKLRTEVFKLKEEKTTIIQNMDILKEEEVKKKKQLEDLDEKIERLNQVKEDLQNGILPAAGQDGRFDDFFSPDETGNSEFTELGAAEVPSSDLNEKIRGLDEQEEALRERVKLKQDEISELEENGLKLVAQQNEIDEKIQSAEAEINSLEQKKLELNLEIDQKKSEIEEQKKKIEALQEKHKELESSVTTLFDKEKDLKARLDELEKEEKSLSDHTEEFKKIEKDLEERKRLLHEAENSFTQVSDETNSKQKELYAIDQTLSIKADRLTKLNLDLLNIEKKFGEIKEEITGYEKLRMDLQGKVDKEKRDFGRMNEQYSKLKELVPLLEKRRKEIEQSNSDLENRFTNMFQRFNKELNEINKKRNVLEQIVLKKEKDLDEKDQQLFEKIASLEESESVLNVRQVETESIQELVNNLNAQKENLKRELQKMDEESIERKNYNTDLKLETELLLKKKISLEKGLQELLKMTSDSYYKTEERKIRLNEELKMYEEKLVEYRDKISGSMNEFTGLQSSLGTLKTEHQKYKSDLSKMASMKKRLQEELLKQQTVLQKYQKIREKLKIEHGNSTGKKVAGPYQGDTNETKTKGKDTNEDLPRESIKTK